jgi:hypothetical protein
MTQMTQHRPGSPMGFPPREGPAGGVPPTGPHDWPRHQAQRRELVIVGAHGGAGTTTLAVLLQPAWDMGALRPGRDARYPALIAHGRPLLLVCRNTASAAAAATTGATALARPGAPINVLVVVSDGWPDPPAATARFRLLEPRVGAIVRVPFIPAFRVTGDPAAVPLPGRARRVLDQIASLTGRPTNPR